LLLLDEVERADPRDARRELWSEVEVRSMGADQLWYKNEIKMENKAKTKGEKGAGIIKTANSTATTKNASIVTFFHDLEPSQLKS
jgi:hypothetical protein